MYKNIYLKKGKEESLKRFLTCAVQYKPLSEYSDSESRHYGNVDVKRRM